MSKPIADYTNDELVKHRDCINEEIKRRKESERLIAREKAAADNEAFISIITGNKIERFSWVSHSRLSCNDDNLCNADNGKGRTPNCARCYLLTILNDNYMDDDVRPVLRFEYREELDRD